MIIEKLQSASAQVETNGELDVASSNKTSVVFEFGVAYGYSSNYFLEKIKPESYLHYGFDSFMGLSRGFREFPKGAFSTEGLHPDIDDS